MNARRFWTLTALIVVAVATRLLPHDWNLASVTAIALFGGATFERRRDAVLVPLLALLLSDALLQVSYLAGWQPNWGFYPDQWVTYAATLAVVGLGFLLRRRLTLPRVAATALAGSLAFFLITNFAVWAYNIDTMYPRTLSGLMTCYEAGLPFLRNSLRGDALYVALLFGGFALAESRFPVLRRREHSLEPAIA